MARFGREPKPEEPVRDVLEHDLLTLTAEEQTIFVQSVLNPPPTNVALQKATRRYKKLVPHSDQRFD